MKKITKRIRCDLATTTGLALDRSGDGDDREVSDVPNSIDTEIYNGDDSIATGFCSDEDDIVSIDARGRRAW